MVVQSLKKTENEYIIDGRIQLRSLNRRMQWALPLEGASTLSGLITEYLSDLPNRQTSIQIKNYQITIISVNEDNVVEKAYVKRTKKKQLLDNA